MNDNKQPEYAQQKLEAYAAGKKRQKLLRATAQVTTLGAFAVVGAVIRRSK